MSGPERVPRRELIGSIVRCAVGGGLLAVTGSLVLLPVNQASKQECMIDRLCKQCVAFGGCSFPKAVAARKQEPSERTGRGQLR